MNKPLISCIVPVYNAEKYIVSCVDSIISQSFKDWELLLIDDGSTDASGHICDQLLAKDQRISVYHKENGGVSSARNFGLEKICGSYVCFFDADDELYPDSLLCLVSGMDDTIGSSVGGFIHIDDSHKELFKLCDSETKLLSLSNAIEDFYNTTKQKDWQRYLWNRLFRTDIIKRHKLQFREDIYYKEDGLFLIQYLVTSNLPLLSVNKVVYKYRINPNSATGSLANEFNPKLLTNILAHNAIVQAIIEANLDSKIQHLAKMGFLNSFYWVMSCVHDKSKKRLYLQEYKPILVKSVGRKLYYKHALIRLTRLVKYYFCAALKLIIKK